MSISRNKLNHRRTQRVLRVRARIVGSAEKPRLAVFRSNRGFSAQLIDDEKGHTLASVSMKNLSKEAAKKAKSEQAAVLGELIAKKAVEAGVKTVVFDRRSYAYHGRVRSFAEAARKGGLQF
jgi:large subunit ribosomal protein L18